MFATIILLLFLSASSLGNPSEKCQNTPKVALDLDKISGVWLITHAWVFTDSIINPNYPFPNCAHEEFIREDTYRFTNKRVRKYPSEDYYVQFRDDNSTRSMNEIISDGGNYEVVTIFAEDEGGSDGWRLDYMCGYYGLIGEYYSSISLHTRSILNPEKLSMLVEKADNFIRNELPPASILKFRKIDQENCD